MLTHSCDTLHNDYHFNIIGTLQALKADLQKGTCVYCVVTITNGYSISMLFIIHTAERADVEYWDNPQVYLVPGDEHVEAHFVLHNFKSTEPLNTSQLKNLKIAGTLKYKVYILFRYQVNYLKVC